MDWPPDWGDIYAIAFYDFASCCPICLEDFVAPLITPCGHIFCAHCIYKVTSPRLQSTCTIDVYKCPICSQIGVTRELLRHLIFHKVEPKVGRYYSVHISEFSTAWLGLALRNTPLTFRLMYRRTGSQAYIPLQNSEAIMNPLILNDDLDNLSGKYYTASVSSALLVLERAKADLLKRRRKYTKDKECSTWHATYLSKLEAEISDIKEAGGKFTSHTVNKMPTTVKIESKDHYLYHAENGECIFLDPFCTQMLLTRVRNAISNKCRLMRFSSESSLHSNPQTEEKPYKLSLKVLYFEKIVQTTLTQSRYKDFSFLPLGSEFIICVADLRGHLSKEELIACKSALETRRRRYKILLSRGSNEVEDVNETDLRMCSAPESVFLEENDCGDCLSKCSSSDNSEIEGELDTERKDFNFKSLSENPMNQTSSVCNVMDSTWAKVVRKKSTETCVKTFRGVPCQSRQGTSPNHVIEQMQQSEGLRERELVVKDLFSKLSFAKNDKTSSIVDISNEGTANSSQSPTDTQDSSTVRKKCSSRNRRGSSISLTKGGHLNS